MGKARELLEFTQHGIDMIARGIGYDDPASFRKVFKRLMGMSPGDYRRRFAVVGPDGYQPTAT